MRFTVGLLVLSLASVAFAAPAENFLDGLKNLVDDAVQKIKTFGHPQVQNLNVFDDLKKSVDDAVQKIKNFGHPQVENLNVFDDIKKTVDETVQKIKNFGHPQVNLNVFDDIKKGFGEAIDNIKNFGHPQVQNLNVFDDIKKSVSDAVEKIKSIGHPQVNLNFVDDFKKSFTDAVESVKQKFGPHKVAKRSVVDDLRQRVEGALKSWTDFGNSIKSYGEEKAAKDQATVQRWQEQAPQWVQNEQAKLMDIANKQGYGAAIQQGQQDVLDVVRKVFREAFSRGTEAGGLIDNWGEQYRNQVNEDVAAGKTSWDQVHSDLKKTGAEIAEKLNIPTTRSKRSVVDDAKEAVKESAARWTTLGDAIKAYGEAQTAKDKATDEQVRATFPAELRAEYAKMKEMFANGDYSGATDEAVAELKKVVKEFFQYAYENGKVAGDKLDAFGEQYRQNVAADLAAGKTMWEKVHDQLKQNGLDWAKKLGVDVDSLNEEPSAEPWGVYNTPGRR